MNKHLLQLGVVGDKPIHVEMSVLGQHLKVRLLADYAVLQPAGFPTRPGLTGAAHEYLSRTVLRAGTVIELWEAEARTLIAEGFAELAPADAPATAVEADEPVVEAAPSPKPKRVRRIRDGA